MGVDGGKECFCFGDGCVCGGANMRKCELVDVVEGLVRVSLRCARNRLLYSIRFLDPQLVITTYNKYNIRGCYRIWETDMG